MDEKFLKCEAGREVSKKKLQLKLFVFILQSLDNLSFYTPWMWGVPMAKSDTSANHYNIYGWVKLATPYLVHQQILYERMQQIIDQ